MTHLIIALGNPGQEYNFTRHNFGFLALDFYAKIHNLTFTENKKFRVLTATHDNATLVKPTSFYNEIGRPIASLINFYKTPPENILIVCDDFTLDFGRIRYRASGSAGGNNGLKSIAELLATTDFPRLRLGTDNPDRPKIGDTDFVLSRFTTTEKSELPTILTRANTSINDFIGSVV